MATAQTSPVKCVIIGDKDSEKHKIVNFYQPTSQSSSGNKKEHILQIIDKETQEAWKVQARTQSPTRDSPFSPELIEYAEIFIICFSVTNHESLKRIEEVWVPEIKAIAPEKPILLVGTRINERVNNKNTVTYKEGEKLAKKLKLTKYMECAVATNVGLKEIFDEVKNIIHKSSGGTRCQIL